MKKKKLLVPLAVMTLSCGLCAGLLTGCGEHEHDYTEWAHDDTGHWQICVEDGETTDKEPHSWGEDDRCECGAEKPAYGTASGNVKLLKLGEEVNEYAGVTIDSGEDDGIEIDYDSTTGAFSISNARVGKTYKLAISKDGYLTTYVNFQAVKNQNAALGNCTLSYDAFTHGSHIGSDWSGDYGTPAKIDKTHVNDAENPYFKIGEGTGDFYVYSKEEYDTVTASVTYKRGDTNDITDLNDKNEPIPGNQGLRLVFEDGKAVMIRIEKINDMSKPELHGKFKAQWVGGQDWEEAPIKENVWDFGSDEEHFMPFSDMLAEQYAATGVELKLVRNGGVVRAYVNKQFAGEQILPAKYAGQKCRVALAAARVKGGAEIPFSIKNEIQLPASETETVFDSALTFNTEGLPADVTATLDKDSGYKRGDLVTLTLNADAEKYMVKELKLGATSLLGNYADGKVSFILTEASNTLTLTLEAIQYADLENVSVTGKKYDDKNHTIANGTEIILKGQGGLKNVEITVQDGEFSKEHVAQGTYTAEATGYKPAKVVVEKSGISTVVIGEGEKETKIAGITLEYDGFELNWGFDPNEHDYSKVNDAQSQIGCDGKTLNVLTKDSYDDVAVSFTVKDANSRNGNDQQGIWLKFDDGKFLILRSATWGSFRLTYLAGDLWGSPTWLTSEINFYNFNDAETQAIQGDNGIELKLVRDGGKVYTFLGGKFVNAYALPEGYEERKVQVGFWSFDSAEDAFWDFEITKTITTSVTDGTAEGANGTVEISNETPKYGETVTITLTPGAGYAIKSLTVGGNTVGPFTYGEGTVGTYSFIVATASTNIVAEFETATYANVDAEISAKKGTETINLNGAKATLSNDKAIYEVTVADGKLTRSDVLPGDYKLTVEGCVSQTVTVTESGIADEIVLVYNIFTTEPASADLSKLNDGKVIATGNKGVELETKEKYTNVTAEAHFDVPDYASRRYGIALVFNDGKNFRVDLAVQDNGNNILQQTDWNSMMDDGFKWQWVNFPDGYFAAGSNSYTEQEIRDEFIAQGLTYKLERDGATVKLYINGVLMKTYTLPESYANQEAKLKFIFDSDGTDGTKGFTFDITGTPVTPDQGNEGGEQA